MIDKTPINSRLLHHLMYFGVAVASSTLLFWWVGLDSSYLGIDSGPYLSIAHHLVTHGSPVSSFGFLGTFRELPSVPGVLAPGLGLWTAIFLPFTGDPLAAAKIVLGLALFATQLAAIYLIEHRTRAPFYAIGVSLLLVWNGHLGPYAGMVMTELPFIAFLILASLAATRILTVQQPSRATWAGLALASAALCLTRYVGIFLPLVFSAIYACQLRLDQRQTGQQPNLRPALRRLLLYNAAAFAPLGLWLLAASSSGATIFALRPPSQLGVGQAVLDAGAQIIGWIGIWVLLVVVAIVLAGLLPQATRSVKPRLGWAELFLGLATLGYLSLLIFVRTRGALYPLDQLGERYILPAWPLVFLLVAIVIHARVVSLRPTVMYGVVSLVAIGALWLGLRELAAFRLPLAFPTQSATYRALLEQLSPDTTDAVLCNFCQPLAYDRPDARILGIPSREDFVYELDLQSLVEGHDVRWLVLFDLPPPTRNRLYPPRFGNWLREPPQELNPVRWRHFADGAIYQLRPLVGASQS